MMGFDIADFIQKISIFMPGFLLALVIHEYAHAWMAQRFGDQSAAWSGRLTLNPLVHLDPIGTVVFPLISLAMQGGVFFGWARPVPIDPRQFRNYRRGLFWVSFAGPLANILLGFLAALALAAYKKYVSQDFSMYAAFGAMMDTLIVINFALAVFNLIPIPPLDGSNMVLSRLGPEATRKFLQFQQYSFFILIFLMYSGALHILAYPIGMLDILSRNLAGAVFGLSTQL